MPEVKNADLLVGMDTSDDAGVYKISDNLALVQTVDFFTPVVDDPYDFGQIAVANALSDIYAMGAKPLTALNIVGFPIGTLDKQILAEILKGGADKAAEAGVTIVGGHSVKDPEVKYGMAITGIMDPAKAVRNNTPREGDAIILTKPLGTGILTTALKKEKLPEKLLTAVTDCMKRLNKWAGEAMLKFEAHAATDVTGFGLAGHLFEMVNHTSLTARIYAGKLPLLPEAAEFSGAGFLPGGLKENRRFLSPHVNIADEISPALQNLLFDPQTSGGMLMAVPAERAAAALHFLREKGDRPAAIVGEFVTAGEFPLEIFP
ncbi:MAG: selenide, water dikinase SelD [Calditrichia bacterium]